MISWKGKAPSHIPASKMLKVMTENLDLIQIKMVDFGFATSTKA